MIVWCHCMTLLISLYYNNRVVSLLISLHYNNLVVSLFILLHHNDFVVSLYVIVDFTLLQYSCSNYLDYI